MKYALLLGHMLASAAHSVCLQHFMQLCNICHMHSYVCNQFSGKWVFVLYIIFSLVTNKSNGEINWFREVVKKLSAGKSA